DDARDVEIARAGFGRPDAHRLVGQPHREGGRVRGGVRDDGADPHLAAGPDDPERDLAPVGNENLVEHQPWVSEEAPSGTTTARTRTAGRCRRGSLRCAPRPWPRSRSSASWLRRCRAPALPSPRPLRSRRETRRASALGRTSLPSAPPPAPGERWTRRARPRPGRGGWWGPRRVAPPPRRARARARRGSGFRPP